MANVCQCGYLPRRVRGKLVQILSTCPLSRRLSENETQVKGIANTHDIIRSVHYRQPNHDIRPIKCTKITPDIYITVSHRPLLHASVQKPSTVLLLIRFLDEGRLWIET